MQSDSLDTTSLFRSDSINMLVGPRISSAATTAAFTCSTFSIPQSISPSFVSIPFHHLSKSRRRCLVCSTYFSKTKSSSSQIERRGAYKQAKSAHFIFLFEHMRKCTELSKKRADFFYIKIKRFCRHFMNQKYSVN